MIANKYMHVFNEKPFTDNEQLFNVHISYKTSEMKEND